MRNKIIKAMARLRTARMSTSTSLGKQRSQFSIRKAVQRAEILTSVIRILTEIMIGSRVLVLQLVVGYDLCAVV